MNQTSADPHASAQPEAGASLDVLRAEIGARRDSIRKVLSRTTTMRQRLASISIVGSALAATATAGPALGGKAFTAWLVEVFKLQAPAWQLLCGLAAVCSLASTIAVQFSSSRKLDERLIQAQMIYAKLERLYVGLSLGEAEAGHAKREYLASLEEIATLEAT